MKSDIPEVGTRMSYICTNLHEITKTDSGHVLSKAQKVGRTTCTVVSLITSRPPCFLTLSLVLCPFTLLLPYQLHFLPSPVFPCFQNQRYCNYTHRKYRGLNGWKNVDDMPALQDSDVDPFPLLPSKGISFVVGGFINFCLL